MDVPSFCAALKLLSMAGILSSVVPRFETVVTCSGIEPELSSAAKTSSTGNPLVELSYPFLVSFYHVSEPLYHAVELMQTFLWCSIFIDGLQFPLMCYPQRVKKYWVVQVSEPEFSYKLKSLGMEGFETKCSPNFQYWGI